jgi:hypothetical protein
VQKSSKKYFFGWTNLKWLIKELIEVYSSKPSYFSKKRLESGLAFITAQWGMIYWLIKNVEAISASELAIWAGIEFAVAGYMVNQIQKEKKDKWQSPE